jgi:hypothetical protein
MPRAMPDMMFPSLCGLRENKNGRESGHQGHQLHQITPGCQFRLMFCLPPVRDLRCVFDFIRNKSLAKSNDLARLVR